MIALIQRVSEASITADGEFRGSIGQGLMVLVCGEKNDKLEYADALAEKVAGYRVFSDADGKMNLNTATEQELSANPAVGSEQAKGIVEFRENVGDIKSMDELLEVKGVTPEVLEKLKQAVTVEAIEGAECSC
mgnify:CR=1 FL=1